jgi:outer membrane protein assembly factor BamA
MRRNQLLTLLFAHFFAAALLHADCAKDQDHRSSTNSGLLVTDFTISGTQTLSSSDLSRITNKLTGSCFNEDSEELEERVRALFQDRGYFGVKVKSLRIKPSDVLAIPKPVTLEAEVVEGPRYRTAGVKFTGNHAFSAARLSKEFSLKKGEVFERDKVAGGLEGIRKLYSSDGFIDFYAIPDTQSLSDSTMSLNLTVSEGPQYRMGKLEVFAKKDLADELRTQWQMAEGTVFDSTYVEAYIDANRQLLPEGFSRENVQAVRNCPDALVSVRLLVDSTDRGTQSRPHDVECESSHESPK